MRTSDVGCGKIDPQTQKLITEMMTADLFSRTVVNMAWRQVC